MTTFAPSAAHARMYLEAGEGASLNGPLAAGIPGIPAALEHLAERYGLDDHFMWANDYPHHEGTWPHSAEAIERTMPMLNDTQRAKILGLNAARFLGMEVPEKYKNS